MICRILYAKTEIVTGIKNRKLLYTFYFVFGNIFSQDNIGNKDRITWKQNLKITIAVN